MPQIRDLLAIAMCTFYLHVQANVVWLCGLTTLRPNLAGLDLCSLEKNEFIWNRRDAFVTRGDGQLRSMDEETGKKERRCGN
jgi:hypothetical protein